MRYCGLSVMIALGGKVDFGSERVDDHDLGRVRMDWHILCLLELVAFNFSMYPYLRSTLTSYVSLHNRAIHCEILIV